MSPSSSKDTSRWIRVRSNDLTSLGHLQRLYFQIRSPSQVPGVTIQLTVVFGENQAEKGSARVEVRLWGGTTCGYVSKGDRVRVLAGQDKHDHHLFWTLGILGPTQSSSERCQEHP